jgi:hypothetical protein
MVTYAQIKRERPGRITFLGVVCLLLGIPMMILGFFGVSSMVHQGEVRGAIALLFAWTIGALAVITGLGLLAMKPWARVAGVVVCVLGTISTLEGIPEVIRGRSMINIVWNVLCLVLQIWIGYFLLQASTRQLFVQAQGEDERVLKI